MKKQMELSFEESTAFYPEIRRQRRLRRARWWFDQMRQVVDRALDRAGDQSERPEQVCFPLEGKAS